MFSERIKAIGSNVRYGDSVLDIGCDHGYASIYVKKYRDCKKVYACDISEKALESAKRNFQKYGVKIKTYVSDGFKNVSVKVDTAIISGVGTNTILKILKEASYLPERLVLGSQNDLYRLRKELYSMGYKLVDERALLEKDHYYVIFLYIKAPQKLTKTELRFGISNNEEYLRYLKLNNLKILRKKIPWKKRIKLRIENLILTVLIERK